MNKKFKKGLYLGGTTLAIAGISSGIIVPIALTSRYSFLKWDGGDWKIGNGNGILDQNDIDKDVDDSDYDESAVLNSIKYQSSSYSYDFEQRASLDFQMLQFKKEIIDEVENINETYKSPIGDDATKEEVKKSIDKIKDIEEKINKLKETIEKTDKDENVDSFYSGSSFSKDYPEILEIKSKIRSRQEKVFNDSKDAFIDGFPTRKQGVDAWFDKRKTDYGGALSDKEAIDFLVNRQISNDANSQFRFRIVDSFTVKNFVTKDLDIDNFDASIFAFDNASRETNSQQFVDDHFDYSIKTRKNTTGFLFPFLDEATMKDYTNDTVRENSNDDKVFFLGTASKQKSKINVLYTGSSSTGLANNPLTKKLVDNTNLLQTSHALINVKPNENGPHLPWTTTKETIKKLFSMTDSNVKYVPYMNIETLFQDDDNTDRFIRLGSGNSAGTIDKKGSLGLKSADEFVTSMVGGFGTGLALGYTTSTQGIAQADNLTAIKNSLHTEISTSGGFFGDLQSDSLVVRNQKIDQTLNNATDEKINEVFGGIFKNIFDPTGDGNELIYTASSGESLERSVLVSEEHGVHITQLNKITSANDLSTLLSDNMQIIADKQSNSAAPVEFNTIFTNYYDEFNQIDFLLSSTGKDSFNDYYIKNAYDNDPKKAELDIERIKAQIQNRDENEARTKAKAALDSKYSWYKDSVIDGKRIGNQLNPNDMYDIFYDMSRKGGRP